MRSVIYGTIITVFLASAGTVQAANELDGKALLCTSKHRDHPIYGLVFNGGQVSRWQFKGYSKVISYKSEYRFQGLKKVWWFRQGSSLLNRETLKIGGDQCSISTKTEIFQKLDKRITAAKKKNKF
jgi:hypothetical protein